MIVEGICTIFKFGLCYWGKINSTPSLYIQPGSKNAPAIQTFVSVVLIVNSNEPSGLTAVYQIKLSLLRSWLEKTWTSSGPIAAPALPVIL